MSKDPPSANRGPQATSRNECLLFILRLVLGSIFIASGIAKLSSEADFVGLVTSYNLLPNGLAEFYGSVLPWVELMIGGFLILGLFSRVASGIGITLVISFIIANTYTTFGGAGSGNGYCGCFGETIPLSHTGSLVLNVMMLLVALPLVFHQSRLLSIGTLFHEARLGGRTAGGFACSRAIQLAMVLLATLMLAPTSFVVIKADASGTDKAFSYAASSETPLDSEVKSALESGSLAFLFFYTESCPYCNDEKPLIDELEREYVGEIAFLRVDGDNDPGAIQKFNVVSYPTMLLISGKDTEGAYEYETFAGFTDKETLKASFDYLLQSHELLNEAESQDGSIADQCSCGYQDAGNQGISSGDCPGEGCSAGSSGEDCFSEGCSAGTPISSDTDRGSASAINIEIDTALANGKPVFLFIYADWCGYCQKQKPIVEELEEQYAGNIAFVRVNGEEQPQAVTEFEVTGFPAMFLIIDNDEDGYIHQRFNGFKDMDELTASVDYVVQNGSLPEDSGYEGRCVTANPEDAAVASLSDFWASELDSPGCCAQSIVYDNMRDLGCAGVGYPGWCGAAIRYDITEVLTACPDQSCEGRTLTEALISDNGCGPTSLISGIDCMIGPTNNCIGVPAGSACDDNYFLCYPIGGAVAEHCVETYTQVLYLDDTPVQLCTITFELFDTTSPACSATVSRSCVPYIDPAICTQCDDDDGWYERDDACEYRDYYCSDGVCEYDVPEIQDCDDGDECTANVCDKDVGCSNLPCDDGNLCTIDYCVEGEGCHHTYKDCDDNDECTSDWCDHETGACRHQSISGCDSPDDNYDVSTLEATLDESLGIEVEPVVAILRQGDAYATQNILADLSVAAGFADIDFSPDFVENYPILVIPSGGLYGLDSLASFKSNLDEFVQRGGTLIVFSQQHGYEYSALPGGELSGYGWLEDQSCQHGSVGINTYHPILAGQKSATSDVNVDGFFTDYPESATVLLTRVKNGMPAMIMYEYGQGMVVATAAFTDVAYKTGMATQDGKRLVRDMISWAQGQEEVLGYGTSDTLDIPVDIVSHLPAGVADYPVYAPGDTVSLSVNITNSSEEPAVLVVFSIFDPDQVRDNVKVPLIIMPGVTASVPLTYETSASSKPGLYSISPTLLYVGPRAIEQPVQSGFRLVVDISDLSAYRIDFILRDPDKNIVHEESTTLTVPPGETVTEHFSYANPSELGIWTLEYEILDYNDVLVDSDLQTVAVSKYAQNPEGWVYEGSDITFGVTSDRERYPHGSEASFTIHVWNHGDTHRTVTCWYSFPHNYWGTGNPLYGAPGTSSPGHQSNLYDTLIVPAHDVASFNYSVPLFSYDRLWADFYEGDATSSAYLGRASRGFYTYDPQIEVSVSTDRQEYFQEEDVSISLNLENTQEASRDVATTVIVLDPENNKVYDESFTVSLPQGASDERVFSFARPSSSEDGVYAAIAEVYVGGQKAGSGSAYFKSIKV